VPLALQIAEALEAAHEKGIVHRDLKPANVMIRPDGTVKVLDFGLAKAWESEAGDSALSFSPTLTQHNTQAGVILGTAAYMAPEQAAGQAADRRSDIWSFGVVLWEMLSGQKLFAGETVSHVLASVLKDEIDLDALPDDLPPRVAEVVRRCLERKPKRRMQAIGDVRVLLEEWLENPEIEYSEASAIDIAGSRQPRWKQLLPWVVVTVLAVGLLTTVWPRAEQEDPAPIVRFQIVAPESLTSAGPPTISPDGRSIAYNATDENGATQIWLRAMDDLEAHPLAGTDGSGRPFWSPDSRYLGFVAGGKLKKVPITGGPPQTLADTPTAADGSWGTGGAILIDGTDSDPILRVPAAGGTPQPVVKADPEAGIATVGWPQFLPDGQHFLYTADGATQDDRRLMAGSLDPEEAPHEIFITDSLVKFVAPGHLLYVREDSLLAQPFNPETLEITGEPVPLAEELGTTGTGLADFSASVDGTLVFRSGWTAKRRLVWLDRFGRRLDDADEPAVFRSTDLSPDGKQLAMTIEDPRSDNVDLWLRDLARGVTSRFTFDPGRENNAVWSPDGRALAYASLQGDSYAIVLKEASGTAPAEELLRVETNTGPNDWSADGRWLALNQRSAETGWDIVVLDLGEENRGKLTPFVQGRFMEVRPSFSPDAKWIAYQSNESGRSEIYVQQFPGPGGKWQISTDGGSEPRWSDDGSEIFYLTPASTLMSVPVSTGDTLSAGRPQELFDVRLQPITTRNRWLVSRDGQRFLFLQPEGSSRSLPTTVVMNWAESLKER
jgi:Tol biopolymer transport system component